MQSPNASMSRAQMVARLISPRSVAIVGASADFNKLNGRPLKHLIEKGYAGRILPVNPKYKEIGGHACYPSIAALPEAADLAIVAVPASDVIASVEALGRRGVRSAVIFSSGFGEAGAEGKALEARLLQAGREAGVILCGPNCLGFVNAFDNLYATFSQYADGDVGAGPVAFVTQSGAFGTATAALIRQRGLGLGYFISTGNEADLSFAELMAAVVEDERIKVAAGYLEGLNEGEALVSLALRCHALGKPLVIAKVGRRAAGQKAAASHTGALAVEDTVLDAVLTQYGILRARNEEHMLDMLEALVQPRVAHGNGLGIATMSGGAGVMMADRADEVGLAVPELGPDTRARIATVMPAFGASANPVDVTGQFLADPAILREAVVAMMEDPAIHVGIVWLQLMAGHVDRLVKLFCEIRDRTCKPLFVCWTAAPAEAVRRLRAEGITVFGAGERAVEAASALVRAHAGRRRVLARPAPAALAARPGEVHDGVQPSVQATAWLQGAGVPMAPVSLARSADEAVLEWRRAGGSVALKIESPDITHKTEVGGVLLGLDDEAAIRRGFDALMGATAAALPSARLEGVLVQKMAAGHVELVVGVQRSPVFGMVVMVGLGGILVEVLKDVAFRRAPFAEEEALDMLSELRASAILDGVRGKPGVDRMGIARMLARLSQWAAGMQPVLSELDLNPVLVSSAGPLAVDCVMVIEKAGAP
ncbi:MAG: acetate--CoA ligase family protein [Hyphomicrobiaceae bacterium]|nr:acetate--CoA ligase family protein [Hyphomicrobiaceae bacterium]